MSRTGIILACVLFFVSLSEQVFAQDRPGVAPWVFELKGGQFKPDLDLYEDFYGSDKVNYFAAALAYRPSDWFEFGGELGYMHDSGVGLMANNQTLGGSVKYKLMPFNLYANIFGRFSPKQWVVPYVGAGLTMAYYKQDILSQPDRSGRTDLGYNVRGGLQLLLNRLDRGTAKRAAQGGLINTYLFVEGQYFSTEVDNIDLGGVTYLLGLRMEFDFSQ